MTDETETASEAPPLTYHEASGHYRGVAGARERYEELLTREMDSRLAARLRSQGKYEPGKHDSLRDEPLTTAEHLELIATGHVLANYYGHVTQLDHAVQAGATWEQIAAARGSSAQRARAEYREWAGGQHDMFAGTGHWAGEPHPEWGMSDEEYAEALARAAEPGQAPRRSAGLDQATAYLASADREAGQ